MHTPIFYRFILMSMVVLCHATLKASPINTDSLLQAQKQEAHRLSKMMVSYEFNINTANDATFSHELDFHWYFLKYMGIGFGLELDNNNSGEALSLFLSDDSYNDNSYNYDPDNITKFNFHPMLSFRTPPVWFSHDSSWGVLLRCDPGLVMSLPANDHIWIDTDAFPPTSTVAHAGNVKVTNHDGKWLFWRIRSALSFYNEFGMFSVGCSFSNYNINYCRNNMVYNGRRFYTHERFEHTWTLFLALSVCF